MLLIDHDSSIINISPLNLEEIFRHCALELIPHCYELLILLFDCKMTNKSLIALGTLVFSTSCIVCCQWPSACNNPLSVCRQLWIMEGYVHYKSSMIWEIVAPLCDEEATLSSGHHLVEKQYTLNREHWLQKFQRTPPVFTPSSFFPIFYYSKCRTLEYPFSSAFLQMDHICKDPWILLMWFLPNPY